MNNIHSLPKHFVMLSSPSSVVQLTLFPTDQLKQQGQREDSQARKVFTTTKLQKEPSSSN
jgi:hypothetical protein